MSIITYLFLISFTMFLFSSTSSWKKHSSHPFISDVSATFKVIEWLGPPSLNSFLFCLVVLFFTARRSSIWVRLFLATIPSLLWPSFLREQKTTVSFQKRDHYQSNWNLSYILGYALHSSIIYYYTKIQKQKPYTSSMPSLF